MSRTKQMIAIDVGTRSVKAVWVQMRGSTPVLTRAETFSLPMDAEEPHKLISAWVESIGLSGLFCAVALPGAQVVFQGGRIMHNDPRTPEQVAAIDIAQFSEMAGDEMLHDVFAFEPGSEKGVRRYIMSMARPSSLNAVLLETRLNHIRPADLIAAPVALHNAIETIAGPHDAPWCYINIGHTQSEVAVGLNNGLLFARSIPVGGKLFTEAVAQAAAIPLVQAEVRKHSDCGLNAADAFCEHLRAASDRWLSQLNACIGVYRSQFQDRRLSVSRFILTGGGSQLKGLKEYLSEKLSAEVILSSELPGVKELPKKHSPSHDIAFGLAVTAMRAGPSYLSLLPDDLKDEVVFREKKPWWIAAAFFLTATMAVYSATGVILLKRDGQQLDEEREHLRRREQIDKRIQAVREMCSQILTNSVSLNNLLMNGPLSREVLTLVASSADPNDGITLFCDEKIYNPAEQENNANAQVGQAVARTAFSLFRTLRPTPRPDVAAAKTTPRKKELLDQIDSVFIVEGYTPNPSLKSVREMIERLKTSPAIARVDLRSDDRVLAPVGIPGLESENLPNFRRFVIEIEVKRQ